MEKIQTRPIQGNMQPSGELEWVDWNDAYAIITALQEYFGLPDNAKIKILLDAVAEESDYPQ